MSEDRTGGRPGADEPAAALKKPQDVTVLVVDDEPDVVSYFSSVLDDAGLNVLTALDGDQALEILGQNDVDLISLDLVMPRKSGIRLFMELRRNPSWARIPVVFVTGHARDPDVKKDMAAVMADSTMVGPSLYLEKPVTPESYLSHICKIVGVEHEEAVDETGRADELRREAGALLKNADAKTLQEMLQRLKGGGK